MRKIIFFALIFSVLVGGIGAGIGCNDILKRTGAVPPSAANYLLLGIDEVGINSDVILLIGYKSETKAVTVMQVPRDTYFEREGQGQRINQVYATHLQQSGNREIALQDTADTLSKALNVPIEGAIACNIHAFSQIVDAIGGVPIHVPFDMEYYDDEQGLMIRLPKGETVLNGETAEQFVRFRASYVEGDLGRLDAQKRFMASFLRQAMKQANLTAVFSCFAKNSQDITVSLNLKNATKTLADCKRNQETLEISFLSIPGEAVQLPGMGWCYAINREATRGVLNACFLSEYVGDATFDPSDAFCAKGNAAFENIYFSHGFEYKIYTQENVDDIKIIEKE